VEKVGFKLGVTEREEVIVKVTFPPLPQSVKTSTQVKERSIADERRDSAEEAEVMEGGSEESEDS